MIIYYKVPKLGMNLNISWLDDDQDKWNDSSNYL